MLACAAVMGVAACGDDGSGVGGGSVTPDTGLDAGTADDAAAKPPNFQACRDVTRGGSLVESLTLPDNAPEAFGGPIQAGIYDLDDLVIYSGKPPQPGEGESPIYPRGEEKAQVTIEIVDGAIRMASGSGAVTDSGFATETLSTGWITPQGALLVYDGICPTREQLQVPYSTVGDTIVLYTRPDRLETYRRR